MRLRKRIRGRESSGLMWHQTHIRANSAEVSELMVKLIRQIGVKRILFGSDAAAAHNLQPRESWEAFRQLKLSEKEFKTIAGNVAPYFH